MKSSMPSSVAMQRNINPFVERELDSCLSSDDEVQRYVFPITDSTPSWLLALAYDDAIDTTRNALHNYIRQHRVQRVIKQFEQIFCATQADPIALATILKTVRHYHNGLRGGLLHLAGRITEDTRPHRGTRDRVGAAGPLFAAFDEFTDNPNYIVSVVTPLLQALLAETNSSISVDSALAMLGRKGLLRRDEPHLERFYGVVDELHRAGTIAASSDEIDQENPGLSDNCLPKKAVNAYQARRILTKRPDLSCAGACAFMFGNETVAGLLYGKLYKGFRKFQTQYGLSDHACDYFGDHASEDGEDGAPAFEACHAGLMFQAVLMYGALGRQHREQIFRGLHLFLETYAQLVESLCEVLQQKPALGGRSVAGGPS